MGQSAEKGLPESWGGKENANILWKTPLPHFDKKLKADHNQSSPIVWADRIFVTTSFWGADKTQKEYPEHHLTCYATDGTQKWDAKVEPGLWLLSDLRGRLHGPNACYGWRTRLRLVRIRRHRRFRLEWRLALAQGNSRTKEVRCRDRRQSHLIWRHGRYPVRQREQGCSSFGAR